ncbi:unnamed protein product [Trifolium pratense]|uniref:Uncharacterized protein n=1 Tax=Trifolium pratense TaxID=57577 RepID=A0ACB0LH23_TRIPR|nr:unnamed protein product [Trifolium pratense]
MKPKKVLLTKTLLPLNFFIFIFTISPLIKSLTTNNAFIVVVAFSLDYRECLMEVEREREREREKQSGRHVLSE